MILYPELEQFKIVKIQTDKPKINTDGYIILIDPTAKEIEEKASCRYNNNFIFSFMTKIPVVDDVYNDLPKNKFIVKPIFIGSVPEDKQMDVAKDIVEKLIRR